MISWRIDKVIYQVFLKLCFLEFSVDTKQGIPVCSLPSELVSSKPASTGATKGTIRRAPCSGPSWDSLRQEKQWMHRAQLRNTSSPAAQGWTRTQSTQFLLQEPGAAGPPQSPGHCGRTRNICFAGNTSFPEQPAKPSAAHSPALLWQAGCSRELNSRACSKSGKSGLVWIKKGELKKWIILPIYHITSLIVSCHI